MTTKSVLQEISVNLERLAGDHERSAGIRKMAGDALDLTALMTSWPVPRSLNLDADLRRQLAGLCRQSGVAVCGMPQCMVQGVAAGDAACRVA